MRCWGHVQFCLPLLAALVFTAPAHAANFTQVPPTIANELTLLKFGFASENFDNDHPTIAYRLPGANKWQRCRNTTALTLSLDEGRHVIQIADDEFETFWDYFLGFEPNPDCDLQTAPKTPITEYEFWVDRSAPLVTLLSTSFAATQATFTLNATDLTGISSATWNYGDGAIATLNTIGSHIHLYPAPGIYNVSVNLIDNAGHNTSQSFAVTAPATGTAVVTPVPGVSKKCKKARATFTALTKKVKKLSKTYKKSRLSADARKLAKARKALKAAKKAKSKACPKPKK